MRLETRGSSCVTTSPRRPYPQNLESFHSFGSSRQRLQKPCDGNMSQAIPPWFLSRLLPKSSHVASSSTAVLGLSSTLRCPATTIPSTASLRPIHTCRSGSRASETRAFAPTVPHTNVSRSLPPTRLPSIAPYRELRQGKGTTVATHSRILSATYRCRTYSTESKSENGRKKVEPRHQSEAAPTSESSSTQSSPSKGNGGGDSGQGAPAPEAESFASSMSKYLPSMPHRPTKEELLAAATNFRQRLKVRFKWMSIRSMRPWNADEWGAFVSWFMLGHLVWILLGTTTFFSLVILSINTVFAQGNTLGTLGFIRMLTNLQKHSRSGLVTT